MAVQAANGGAYGAGQATAVDVLFYEVRDDLRVRLGGEDVPAAAELGAQLFVVLDDAVEDDGDVAAAVGMRVGVLFAGLAVSGPARVAKTHTGVRRADGGGDERVQVADGTHHTEAVFFDQGDAGRVVAAILEAPEAVKDDGLAGPAPDVADDSAHALSFVRSGQGRDSV